MVISLVQDSSLLLLAWEDDEPDDVEEDVCVLVAGVEKMCNCQVACWREAQCSKDSTAGFRREPPVASPQHTTGLSRV